MTALQRGVTPDGREAWMARSYRHVADLMADNRLWIQPPDTSVSSWGRDSPMHRVMIRLAENPVSSMRGNEEERSVRRAAMSKMFMPSSLRKIEPDLSPMAHQLIDDMVAAGTTADLVESYSMSLALEGICRLLDVPSSDGDLFRAWADDQAKHEYPAAATAIRGINSYVKTLVEERQANPRDDVVSMLLAAQDKDEHHIGRIQTLVTWMLGLGWQVTGHAINFGFGLLFRYPDQRKDLLEHPEVITTAVEEVLRHFNPTPVRDIGGADRFAQVDFDYDGTHISAGDMVVLDVGSANHDAEMFDNPHDFDIRRNPNQHLTFGHGYYYCNFNQVARREMACALSVLLTRLPTIRLAVPEGDLESIRYPASGFARFPVTWADPGDAKESGRP